MRGFKSRPFLKQQNPSVQKTDGFSYADTEPHVWLAEPANLDLHALSAKYKK
ncbi:hypothetical protein [Streptococcus chenjunshii]|uniref:hypothetical protein n=1 Tax=Streptococcus chenjunshii TaxID=2173853 RepID=UPI0013C2DE21|nr:hypothetical protein [Streptococcus chenjunshii]